MHPDWYIEIKHLDFVIDTLKKDLEIRLESDINIKKEMREINKSTWEEAGALSGHSTLEEAPTYLQGVMLLKQKIMSSTENKKRIYRLRRQIESPYFCRIDFKEDDYILEKIYIGTYGHRIEDTGEILIYDWRAPISSIFYDFEPGKVQYESPSGSIGGELFLKRQYRILWSKLNLMFDSNIAIDDNILQDILAQSSNNKMKTIVSTIQKEQNKAIRYEGKKIMVVQGPAGSGKTSIALHRAAYLLYRYRDKIKSENILLLTPNTAFIEYISSVLPELGEEELKCVTLVDLTKKILKHRIYKYETYAEMLEWKLATTNYKNNPRLELAKFKSTQEFVDILDKFIDIYENKIINFQDIKYKNKIFMSKNSIKELFYDSFKYMPINKRLIRIKNIVSQKISEYEKATRKKISKDLSNDSQYVSEAERNAVGRKQVKNDLQNANNLTDEMFSIDIINLYITLFKDFEKWNLFENTISKESILSGIKALENRTLFFEDQAPILYLMMSLGIIDADRTIKHIIIDEAQDYSITTFKLFSKLYKDSNITILGDSNQNINPFYGIGSLDLAGNTINKDDYEYIVLNKSYRSTLEIMNFASKILPANTIPYGRNGNEPQIIIKNNIKNLCNSLFKFIENNKEKYSSIAIIGRTLSDCKRIYNFAPDNIQIKLVENGDNEISEGINILPSYLSKGMEFDAVLATILSKDDYYYNEDELFYTVCTRALHILNLYSIEDTKILNKIL
jgi:DNA helicase-2/ATP-dependent DNA helicase PcrA